MMAYYYVKTDLYGIAAGHVERFAAHKASVLVQEGMIEPFDERKHAGVPGAPQMVKEKKKANR